MLDRKVFKTAVVSCVTFTYITVTVTPSLPTWSFHCDFTFCLHGGYRMAAWWLSDRHLHMRATYLLHWTCISQVTDLIHFDSFSWWWTVTVNVLVLTCVSCLCHSHSQITGRKGDQTLSPSGCERAATEVCCLCRPTSIWRPASSLSVSLCVCCARSRDWSGFTFWANMW